MFTEAERRERKLAQRKAYYYRHREKCLKWAQEYQAAHREQTRATWKRFYQRHLDAERERSRQRDPESKRESHRKWSQAVGKLYFLAKESRRRARQQCLPAERVDYAKVIHEANGMCGICREPMNGEPAHIDHILPLARGGTHTQENLQLAHARCNIRKGVKLLRVG